MRLIDGNALKASFCAECSHAIACEDCDLDYHFKYIARTIDAEPVRHGRWIMDRLISESGGTYRLRKCAVCERCYQEIGYGWDYCPNCGAKMDLEEDDETD